MSARVYSTVITIDGPAGAGKSTLGELLSERLGYLYFDTGIMYRALTLVVLRDRIDPTDAHALESLAKRINIEVIPPIAADGRQYTVLVDGVDVTWELRGSEVDRTVSLVASYPAVRAEMVRQQRAIGVRGCVVMVGRDIGTVVMPDAGLKIYLDASLEARVRRRAAELQARGRYVSLDTLQAEMARRDAADRHVMRPADDALLLFSDTLAPDEEVSWILEHLAKRQPSTEE